MKILHVITSLFLGREEKLVYDLVLRFSNAGYEAEVTVFNAVDTPLMKRLKDERITVHQFAPEGGKCIP